MKKNTKIVCTIGPASSKVSVLRKMMRAGMNVARLNFSHGDYPAHSKLIASIRKAAKLEGADVTLLQDLQGPRIRIGDMKGEVMLKRAQKVALVTEKIYKQGKKIAGYTVIPQQYDGLYKDVKKKSIILIADGTIRLSVDSSKDGIIKCIVVVPGKVKAHKGINVPGVTLKAQVITPKDKRDIEFGCKKGVDYIALSFVKGAANIKQLKKLIKEHTPKKQSHAKTIAKIERGEAIANFDKILGEVDGIMFARGDLALEIHPEEVPILQKELIIKCLVAAKPIIVATQMLESMTNNIQPTRAEISDVANAVIDHTDAIMLSGESAMGMYPVQTVELMSRIAVEAEESHYDDLYCGGFRINNSTEALADAMCSIVKPSEIELIVLMTSNGENARIMSRYRPDAMVVAITDDKKTAAQCNLLWGVKALYSSTLPESYEKFIKKASDMLIKEKLAKRGQNIVFLSDYQMKRKKGEEGVSSVHIGKL